MWTGEQRPLCQGAECERAIHSTKLFVLFNMVRDSLTVATYIVT